MPRLIDDVRAAREWRVPWWIKKERLPGWRDYAKRMIGFVMDPAVEIVVADELADYYFAGTGKEIWNYESDFVDLAPPHPVMWIEHRLPTVVISDVHGVKEYPGGARVGMLFIGVPKEDAKFEGDAPPDWRWVYCCDRWVDYGERKPGIEGPY